MFSALPSASSGSYTNAKVTTGVPIYLVSACASGEEFVAAFRRYSDRGSLFVPIAEPLPPGRRGRIALTLTDGGVMLEGEVDIVSSSKSASILHGRIGMTIRFVDPEEPTKTLLVELDRARLAIRPSPPSVAARPAEVPAAPRAVPPAAAGRIDAASALAECVTIGDLGTLREGAAPLKPGPKFVMPSIPGAGKKVPTIPPKFSTAPADPIPIPVVTPIAPSKPFRLPTPPPTTTEPEPVADTVDVDADAESDVAQIVDAPPRGLRPPVNATQPSAVVPPPQNPAPRPTKLPPAARMPTLGMQAMGRTPPLPMPDARPPARDRATDETTAVKESGVRSTEPGVGVPPTSDTSVMDSQPPPAGAALSEPDSDWTMSPTDDAPTPLVIESREPPAGPMTGNWTIALTPDGWGEPEKIAASLPAPGPRTAVSGETAGPAIASVAGERPLEEERPEPAVVDEGKIQIDPTLMEPLTEMPADETPIPPGPPSRPTPLPLPPAPTRTNPYPLQMMATATTASASQSFPAALPFAPQPPPPRPLDGTGPTSAFSEPEVRLFEHRGVGARMANDQTSLVQIKRRRLIIIIVCALVAIGIVIAVLASGGSKKAEPGPTAPVVDDPPKVDDHPKVPDHAIVTATPDAAPVSVEVAPPDAAAPVSTDCAVDIQTVPKDVEIAIDNTTKIGTAPGTVQLPCGVEVKLYLRKPGFAGVIKSITPAADLKPLKVVLVRAQFIVKVSSTPAGATITVAGKAMGITPTTVHLNGFEPVAIQITKTGYVTQEQKLTPKQQNTVVHVKLVPKPRSR